MSSAFLQFHVECQREQVSEGHNPLPVRGGEDDWCAGKNELSQHLAACSAGWACRLVEIGDGDGFDADIRAEAGDGGDQRGPLRANRQPVADVLHVGSGDDFATGELEGSADAEMRIGRIGVLCGLDCLFQQVVECRT